MACSRRVVGSLLASLSNHHRSVLHTALASDLPPQRALLVRGFSSLMRYLNPGDRIPTPSRNLRVAALQTVGHPGTAALLEPRSVDQQVRHVYVEVIDNDLDSALKVYKRKMNISKIEAKLKEKQYYIKPSERRKAAKHYKKLNRARRELGEKIRIVKHRMEKIREVRRLNKEEKRAKAAEELQSK